ncbi:hypothetical protein EE612_050650, partial [Oryza sativa]
KCSLSTSLRLTAHVTSSIVHEQSSNIRYGENRKHGQRYAYHELLYDDSNNICYAKVHTVGWRRFFLSHPRLLPAAMDTMGNI